MKSIDHSKEHCKRKACLICAGSELSDILTDFSGRERAGILIGVWGISFVREAIGRKDWHATALGENLSREIFLIILDMIANAHADKGSETRHRLRKDGARIVSAILKKDFEPESPDDFTPLTGS